MYFFFSALYILPRCTALWHDLNLPPSTSYCTGFVGYLIREYRPDSQCCGLRHWPYGQCRFFPFFLVLVAWANFGFWVNYGQCRFCTAIGPEVANAALPNLSLVAVMSAQLCKRHWPTLHWVWYRNINGIISVVAIRIFKCGDNRKMAPYVDLTIGFSSFYSNWHHKCKRSL